MSEHNLKAKIILKTKLKLPDVTLQEFVIESILGGKNSVQGPLLLKLLIVSLITMSPSIHRKENTARNKEVRLLSFYNVLVSLFNRVIL